jgi:predicted lysophospholipase L1 biosynthesis ABC-type transport system permease subunit
MAAAVALVARAELRHRRAALLTLALLTFIASAVVLTIGAGVRRTDSSLERFERSTLASDVKVQYGGDDIDAFLDKLRDLPMVKTFGVSSFFVAQPKGPQSEEDFDFSLLADPTGHFGVDVDRPRVLEGRLPDPTRPDEVAVNELAVRQTGLGVGDVLTVTMFSHADIEALLNEQFLGFNGPTMDLRIVGIARAPGDLQGNLAFSSAVAFSSGSWTAAHPDAGAYGPTAVIRLRNGAADIPALRAGAERLRTGNAELFIEPAADSYRTSAGRAINVLTTTTLAVLAVTLLASLIAVAQASSRQLAASADVGRLLPALGMSRTAAAVARAAPPAAAVLVGVGAGAAAAALASPLFPLGLARRAEPTPGVRVDPLVLVGGGAAFVALLWFALFVLARRASTRATNLAQTSRPPLIAGAAARAGAGPVAVSGLRYAFASTDRRIPVRSALVGAALGIAGLVATGVIDTSLAGLTHQPSRYGWNWSTRPDAFELSDDLRAGLAADRRLKGAAIAHAATIVVEGSDVAAYAIEPVRGSIALTLRRGRHPAGPSEIALGAKTMRDLGVHIGATVSARSPETKGAIDLVVVGEVIVPTFDNANPSEGASLTPAGLQAVAASEGFSNLVIEYPPGANTAALEKALTKDHELEFSAYSRPNPPGSVQNLDQASSVITAAGAFFAVVALIGLAHALLVATRRHGRDLAVLRAIGLVRSQVRGVVQWHAFASMAAGVVLGIPAGIVAGRLVWRFVVGDLGLIDHPELPLAAIAALVPTAALVAAMLGWLPARRATRRLPVDALRSE